MPALQLEGGSQHTSSHYGNGQSTTVSKMSKNKARSTKMTNGVNGTAGMNGHSHMNGTNGVASTKPDPHSTFHNLKNWETGKRNTDRLFAKAKMPTTGCTHNRCLGSVMNPRHMANDPRKDIKSKEERLTLAKEFIEEYYGNLKKKDPVGQQKRLSEVLDSIETTGFWDSTYDELVFGCKTAWRNAPRCIGRIQWKQLQVFDYRHVTTTKEMFDAMCKHLEYTTNGGSLRSAITVFPQRKHIDKQFRVWNAQFIRYAGFQMPDGSIIGDPVNVEFTDLCIKLGWKPKKTRFEVLPLILQANGEDPDLYELPDNLVLEVNFKHPKYPWFEDLGLKWYALPGVSNMMLDCGGIEFCGCPFSGWYMGTEVGRDLCDPSRYNVTEEVAIKMGLDTKNKTSLWKDFALMEVNLAILYSFQKDRVTIMDHHTATESFMEHFANEMESRGGCPGDWVWLNPPISGSITPVFHQEILNYMLNPAFLYQTDAVTHHKWKRPGFNRNTKKVHFRSLIFFLMAANSMNRKVMKKRYKATILYATETGKSLKFAKMLRDKFSHAFNAKIACMDQYALISLQSEKLVLVVASTFGDGDPPDNGKDFSQSLLDMSDRKKEEQKRGVRDSSRSRRRPSIGTAIIKRARGRSVDKIVSGLSVAKPRPNEVPTIHSAIASVILAGSSVLFMKGAKSLPELKYSVFGLGSSAYPHFCGFGHTVDQTLEKLEAHRILEVGEGDELSGQEESFAEWMKNVFKAACTEFDVGKGLIDEEETTEKYRLKKDVTNAKPDLIKDLTSCHGKGVSACTVTKRRNLLTGNDGRSTILVEIDSSNSPNIDYQPGDHLGVFPCNEKELVDRVIARVDDNVNPDCPVQLEVIKQTAASREGDWMPKRRVPVCSLRMALERYLDITACPTPFMLKRFAEYATDEKEKLRLKTLAKGKREYEEWKFYNFPNLPEFLEEFPSIKVDAALLFAKLPVLQCRYYSISSSPDLNLGEVHLTVAVVEYKTQGGTGPVHHGVCSSYLNRVPIGTRILCYTKPCATFHLPDDPTVPCLLIGPGTGIAPLRSFWQQRMYDIKNGKKVGEMALLFGCRHPEQDHLYKDEIEEAQDMKAITLYKTAFSRLPGKPKKYVQHVLKDEMAKIAFDWLYRKNGHLYICGDVTMADDVKNTFVDVVAKMAHLSTKDARNHVALMKKHKTFHEDIFGASLIPKGLNEKLKNKRGGSAKSKKGSSRPSSSNNQLTQL